MNTDNNRPDPAENLEKEEMLQAILDNQKKLLAAQQERNTILKWIAFLVFAIGFALCVIGIFYY